MEWAICWLALKVHWWEKSSCWMGGNGCVQVQPVSASSAASILYSPSRSSQSTGTCTSAGTPCTIQYLLAVELLWLWFRRGWPVLSWTYRTTLGGRRTGSTPRLRSVCGTAPLATTTPSCSSSSACCCRLSSRPSVIGASSLIFDLSSSVFSGHSSRQDATYVELTDFIIRHATDLLTYFIVFSTFKTWRRSVTLKSEACIEETNEL